MLSPTGRTPTRSRRSVAATVAAVAALALVVAAIVAVVAAGAFAGTNPKGLDRAVLALEITSGPAPLVVYATAVFALIVVVVRRWSTRTGILAAALGLAGGITGAVVVGLANAQNWFGVALDGSTTAWVCVTFAAIGIAIGSLVGAPGWRRIVAVTTVLLALLAGTVGVNAVFGLQRTVAEFVGINLPKPIRLPPVSTASAHPASGPLWQTWVAPAGMPTVGTTGTVQIPNTASGFVARAAGVYLPPAALVANPPTLPLVILMMGQPGVPDPTPVATAMNAYAARHHGLAPIVVVADQLGSPYHDTLCLNTAKYGNARTYLTQDVLGWARSHLHVFQDAAHTVIAGYSNGGECALDFGTHYPNLFGNVVDVSGEAYPGASKHATTLAEMFHGDVAAYRATWPITTLSRTRYADTTAVFTVGTNDRIYGAQARQMVRATSDAGWKTTLVLVPGGHVGVQFVTDSLGKGIGGLYGRLGLADPGITTTG